MKKQFSLLTATLLTSLSVFAAPTAPMQALLDEHASLGPKPIETLSPAEARLQPTLADALSSYLAKRGQVPNDQGVSNVRDMMVQVAAGLIPARIYRPSTAAKLPAIVYFQGGGFVLADRDTYDGSARALAKKTGAIVISVEYRKAPENKFPAAHDDANSAYKWVLDNASSLGIDGTRVAVAGESAGGNLAVNVAIAARDSRWTMPAYVLAVYPIAGSNMETESYIRNANAKPLSKPMMNWFFMQYLVSMDQAQDPRLNLVGANLKSLPPTLIITAEIDPLQTEGLLLAEKMKAAGVEVTSRNYAGVTHEFFGTADIVATALTAQSFAANQLRRRF